MGENYGLRKGDVYKRQILAIAIVVDDAIVVTENATRILDEGKLDARAATEPVSYTHLGINCL